VKLRILIWHGRIRVNVYQVNSKYIYKLAVIIV